MEERRRTDLIMIMMFPVPGSTVGGPQAMVLYAHGLGAP